MEIKDSYIYRLLDDKQQGIVHSCCDFVKSIWEGDRLIQKFTDHSLTHSERVLGYADDIIKHTDQAVKLTSIEAFSLLSGIVLHDIGMQCDIRLEDKSEIKRIAVKEYNAIFNQPFTDQVLTNDEQIELRKNHHLLTAAWLEYSFNKKETTLGRIVALIPNEIIQDIIDICRYHSTFKIEGCADNFIHSNNRKKLVASLVRLCDELDIAGNRVNSITPQEFLIPEENKIYWYLHANTIVNFVDGEIQVYYRVHNENISNWKEKLHESIVSFRQKNTSLINILNFYTMRLKFGDKSVQEDKFADKLDNQFLQYFESNDDKQTTDTNFVIQRTTINFSEVSETACFTNEQIFKILKEQKKTMFEDIKENYLIRDTKNVKGEFNTDFLISDKNFILLGEAGMGKTFFAKKLCYDASIATGETIDNFPLFINLVEYGTVFKDLQEAFYSNVKDKIDITSNDFMKVIEKGGFFIICDGLDEVREEFYKKCIYELRHIISTTNNKFFITCRENRYNEELGDLCETNDLLPLSDEQIMKFLNESRVNHYQARDYLDILRNPLLLSMVPEIVDEQGSFPYNRSEIYRMFFEKIYLGWDAQKANGSSPYSTTEIENFLSIVAFKCFQGAFISKRDFENEITSFFETGVTNLIKDNVKKTGILREDDDGFIFSHKTFKEYFSAIYIVNNYINNWQQEALSEIINKDDFYEVFLFASGLISEKLNQDRYLDLLFNENLKLYCKALEMKVNIPYDCENEFLKNIARQYEKIIDSYFPDIKFLFYPFVGEFDEKGLKLGISGELNEKASGVHYVFHLIPKSEETVQNNLHDTKSESGKYLRKMLFDYSIRANIQYSFSNFKLVGKHHCCPRLIALKYVKNELKEILEKQKFLFDKNLAASYIQKFKKDIPKVRHLDFEEFSEWLKNEVEEASQKSTNDYFTVHYNRVELRTLLRFIRIIRTGNYEYENCLLPSPDIEINSNSYFVGENYSQSRKIEYLEAFFKKYIDSFKEVCSMNFSKIKHLFPNIKANMFKYVVEIKFPDKEAISVERRSDNFFKIDPIVRYYCMPALSDGVEIEVRKTYDDLDDFNGVRENIKKMFPNDYKKTPYTCISTGFSRMMTTHKIDYTPLAEKITEKLKKSLEDVLGKF